jgi:DNA replication protein DnaC
MLTENTITKLQEMRLSTMAAAFKEQLSDPNISELSFEDRFGLIVDKEWATRKNNHLTRLIKKANFADTGACVEDIAYDKARKLDKAQITRIAGCNYIFEHHNLMLLGATGSGKTYIACALGMSAVRYFLSVRYVRLPELLTELAIARTTGTYSKVIEQYKKPALLIIDEWLLYQLKESEARDLLEIAEARYKKGSMIFCSQFDVLGWRDKIGSSIIADAICDRIVHDSYRIVIECAESMRKIFGVDQVEA